MISRASRSCGSEVSNDPLRKSLAKRDSNPVSSSPFPQYNLFNPSRTRIAGGSPETASRSAIAMLLATSRASSWTACGNSGRRLRNKTSRARASNAGPAGRSFISWRSARVQQHQELQLAFACAPSRQRQVEAALASNHMAITLLQGDNRPADARQHFPKEHPLRVHAPARLALVPAIKGRAVGDPAGFAIEPRKAPALAAKPPDVLVRIAPSGKLPVEDSG